MLSLGIPDHRTLVYPLLLCADLHGGGTMAGWAEDEL
ncbi:MAG: hypothetical protein QG660_190, partial [Pseudomonadota bacterium]|nr:hypothetical protein [Pseudomonadota bacterium]